MSKRSLSIILRVSAACVVAIGLVWMLARTDLSAIGDALSRCRPWPIVIAAIINFAIIGSKAVAWRILLAPEHPVPVVRLARYTLISCAASVLVPLRAGELVRLWLLRDRDGVPISRSATVAIAEKLFDVVSMMLLVIPLPLVMDALPPQVSRWIVVLSIGAVVGLVFLFVAAKRLDPEGRWGEIARAVRSIRDPRRVALVVGVLLIGWLVDLTMVHLVLDALGVAMSSAGCVLVLFAINVAVAFPSTPGSVGALELGAVLGLRLLGVSDATSLAFALVYHALQLAPVLALGLAVGAPEIWKRRS